MVETEDLIRYATNKLSIEPQDMSELKTIYNYQIISNFSFYGYLIGSTFLFYKKFKPNKIKFNGIVANIFATFPTIVYYGVCMSGVCTLNLWINSILFDKSLKLLEKYDNSLKILRYEEHICNLE